AGFEIAAFAAVERLRRIEREQPCGARPRRHVRELQLDRLMIADRLAEGLATLGVARRERERALRDADPPRRDVDAAELEPARGLVEALAFPLADQIVRRDAIVLEDELGRIDALVPELLELAADLEATLLGRDEQAHSLVPRLGLWSCFHEQGEAGALDSVRNPGLCAVDHVA